MIPESKWRGPTEDCPEPGLWASPDGMASEYEVSEFLAALVRLMKPKITVETGCYLGHTSFAIAEALKANGRGVLHTCDVDPQMVASLRERADTAGLPIVVHHSSGREMLERVAGFLDVELAFIDSAADVEERKRELEMLFECAPAALVVVHDGREFDRDATLFFPTPRGLALYKK